MNMPTLKDYEDYIRQNDSKYNELLELYDALSSFLTDYESLKNRQSLTQKDIAEVMGTTQSAISRIESMKTNPTYKQLLKMSNAVNGKLYITPMGDMTATVHYDLQELVRECAAKENVSTEDWVDAKLNDAVRKEKSRQNFSLSTSSIKIAEDNEIIQNIKNSNQYEMTCPISESSQDHVNKDRKNLAG